MLSIKSLAYDGGPELKRIIGFDGKGLSIRSLTTSTGGNNSKSSPNKNNVPDIEYYNIKELKDRVSKQLKKLNSVEYNQSHVDYFKAIPEPENIFIPELILGQPKPDEEADTFLKQDENYLFWNIISMTIILSFGVGGLIVAGKLIGAGGLISAGKVIGAGGLIVVGGLIFKSTKDILPSVRDKWSNFWTGKPKKENIIKVDYEKKYSDLMEAVKNTTASFYKLNDVRMKTIIRLYFISHALQYTSRVQEEVNFVKSIFLMKEVMSRVNQESLWKSFLNETLTRDKEDIINNLVMIRAYIEVIREEFVEKSKIEKGILEKFSRDINNTVGLLQKSNNLDSETIRTKIFAIIAMIEGEIATITSTAKNDMLNNITKIYNTIRALEKHMYDQDPNLDSEMEEFKDIANGLDILMIKVAEATSSKELVSAIDEFNFHYEGRLVDAMGLFTSDMETLDRVIEDYSPWFSHHKYNQNRDSFVSYYDEDSYSRFWRQYDIGEKSSIEIMEDFKNNLEKYEDELDIPLYDLTENEKILPNSKTYFVNFNKEMSIGISIEDITMIWFTYKSMREDKSIYPRYQEIIHGVGSYVINRLYKYGIIKNIDNVRMEQINELENILYQDHGVVVGISSLSGRVDPDLSSLLNFNEINSLTMNVTSETYDLLRKFLIKEENTPLEKIEKSAEREVKLFLNWIEYFTLFQLLDTSDITSISNIIQRYIDTGNYYNLKTIIVIIKITDYINKTIIERDLMIPTIRDNKIRDVLDKALTLFELKYGKENEFLDQLNEIENENIRKALQMSVYI